jgi:hypothetical protein
MIGVFLYLFGLLLALVVVLIVLLRLIAREKAQHAHDPARRAEAGRHGERPSGT